MRCRLPFRGRIVSLSLVAIAALSCALAGSSVARAQARVMDTLVEDWCFGAPSNTANQGGRVENSGGRFDCGTCSADPDLACETDADCFGDGPCVDLGSRTELVWWDDHSDGAVNDLATVALAQDTTNLYVAFELWLHPEAASLPTIQLAIDFAPGGIASWYDPAFVLTNPGNCSVSTDRACTSDADCHFCAVSTEPPPLGRPAVCGVVCDPTPPDNTCDMSQVCVNLGTVGPAAEVGTGSCLEPTPDHLLVIDLFRWLIGLEDHVAVMENVGGVWLPIPGTSIPVLVSPNAFGVGVHPRARLEIAVPWSVFDCTGCPAACSCPGFGPGLALGFTAVLARQMPTLDYRPAGAIEDLFTEAVAGTTTSSPDDCPGNSHVTLQCELADRSSDAFVFEIVPAQDWDGDGVCEDADNCPLAANPPADCDQNAATPDEQCDGDADGRGDPCDVCPNDPDPGQGDRDGDGLGNACDADIDGDGTHNAAEFDRDDDGVPEDDGDGTYDPCPDRIKQQCDDNCPLDGNRLQRDRDSDGVGDVCDFDDGEVGGVSASSLPGGATTPLLEWHPEEGATGYNVYRGLIAELPASYGACFRAGVPGPRTVVPGSPSVGQTYFFLVTAEIPGAEEVLGRDGEGIDRPPAPGCPE
ncbi:MAG: hypothetical protein GY716_22815 [bacterium]|nr:hypothetical protein [bacterium]